MNEWNRISGIFVAPRRTFTDLKERPRWIIPFVIVLVFMLLQLVVVFTLKIGLAEQLQRLQEQLSAEQMAQVEKMLRGPLPLIWGGASIIIITPAMFLIVALILNTSVPLLGGEGSFNRVFSVVTYSSLIRIPAIALKVLLMAITGSPTVFTSLILLFPWLQPKGFLFSLLSRIDLFTIWELSLVALGLGITTKTGGKRPYFLVFGLWLVYLILSSILKYAF